MRYPLWTETQKTRTARAVFAQPAGCGEKDRIAQTPLLSQALMRFSTRPGTPHDPLT